MTVVVAAVVSVVGLIVVEFVRRTIEKRRDAAAAADNRGAAYEAFISEALEAIAIAQRVTALAPRVGVLPPNRFLRDGVKAMEETLATIGRLHARVRRVAPDDVAEAADAVLDVVARAGLLVRDRHRENERWDDLWAEAREARIEFERRARYDTGHSSAR